MALARTVYTHQCCFHRVPGVIAHRFAYPFWGTRPVLAQILGNSERGNDAESQGAARSGGADSARRELPHTASLCK